MANQISTNSLTELVALRAAEAAPYYTVGSKSYFGDQLVGKRNGQTYRFVLRDVGDAKNGLEIDANDKTEITEREIALSLEPWHVAVKTNAIEEVTDLNLDVEIAKPNAEKLVKAAVKKTMDNDLGKVGAAFVGEGFTPLSRASAHLASITSEELYGFCDPNVEAILTSNGQQFVPVNAPDMYSQGLLGKFHGAEYRAQRFFPSVNVSEGLVALVNDSTVTSYTDNSDGTATIVLTAGTAPAADVNIPKGCVFWIDGVYATDTTGDVTAQEKAFIAIESDVATAGTASWEIVVRSVAMDVEGTREVSGEDGGILEATDFAGKKVYCPDEGKYYAGIVRANGAMEFESLSKLEAAGADYESETVPGGLTVHKNKLVDLAKMINITRFDFVPLAGIVESRAVAYFLVK